MLDYIGSSCAGWIPPPLPARIPQGDMPGERVEIGAEQVKKARTIFPILLPMLERRGLDGAGRRAVVTVCGGSGVGKTGIASLLAFYLNEAGLGCYTLSGDNYPLRVPCHNDAERLRVFREGGLAALLAGNQYTAERMSILAQLWAEGRDADAGVFASHPWMSVYRAGGAARLAEYLGSDNEIGFKELGGITARGRRSRSILMITATNCKPTAGSNQRGKHKHIKERYAWLSWRAAITQS